MTTDHRKTAESNLRRNIRVQGLVQGVGFRPFVYRLATSFDLSGWVCNDSSGVIIELIGPDKALDRFSAALRAEAPTQARILSVEILHETQVSNINSDLGFEIRESVNGSSATVPVSPDLATCEDCWNEFYDPGNRRWHYPFINCTQCGPRFTIVKSVPYDRARTTMSGFTMCGQCREEFENPSSRRFHAQPNACPKCGPQLSWLSVTDIEQNSAPLYGAAAIEVALNVVGKGGVIAVKGTGGYHLVCSANNEAAVSLLRQRKSRPHKPLAILARDIETVRKFAVLDEWSEKSMRSVAHPIVVIPKKMESVEVDIAASLSPALDSIGVMLPHTPIHALLCCEGPLVCTSANISDEPIAWNDDEAVERLSSLVDGFLQHDRPIEFPCDDSVVYVDHEFVETAVRRSRGYAPMPIKALSESKNNKCVLAVGAELKSTIAVARSPWVFLSAHLGDVGNPLTLELLKKSVEHMQSLYAIEPSRIACDMHPGYLSSSWAKAYARTKNIALLEVQHHHAHLASLCAEHGLDTEETVHVFTFDGTGYGSDGSIWGGELLRGNARGFERIAHLRTFPLAGGDKVSREPSRSALGLLHGYGIPWGNSFPAQSFQKNEHRILELQLIRKLGVVNTSSMGRFLDACASILGIRQLNTYEGQGAIEMEVLARRAFIEGVNPHSLGIAIDVSEEGVWTMNPERLIGSLLETAHDASSLAASALGVHYALANSILELAELAKERYGRVKVGLSGGVFQNRLLVELAATLLKQAGHHVLCHHKVPCNDGGLALGQAVIAAESI